MISNGQSLSLPATVPVPKDYAQKYDKGELSTYGKHQVFTGPYMIKNDGKGNITGYKAGRRIDLVRNPSWDSKSDYRPAYLDTISFLGGNDINVASRRILSGKKPGQRRLRRAAGQRPALGAVDAPRPGRDHPQPGHPLHRAEHDGQAV